MRRSYGNHMSDCDHLWALVLAAGDGRRLRSLTTTRGHAVPKQYCCLERGPSLLQEALHRAEAVVSPDRICTIVAAQHRRWWIGQLASVPRDNIIVQPQNRGTANGILLPLLSILERDPQARIVVLPADHHVRDEQQLAQSLREAAAPPPDSWAEIVLLGLEPREADPGLGYILPRHEAGRGLDGVERFLEKPSAALAAVLLAQGALWNAFILAADAPALLQLFERRCPDIVAEMRDCLRRGQRGAAAGDALAELYDQLPELDFSRNILQSQEQHLRVIRVPECGWSDLGTPDRVAEALRASPKMTRASLRAPAERPAFLSLAIQHRRLAMVRAAAGDAAHGLRMS